MKITFFLICCSFFLQISAQDSSAICLKKANLYYADYLYRDSEVWFLKAIKADPKNLAVQNQLGFLYFEKLKMFKRGIDVFNNVLLQDVKNTIAIEALILQHYKQRNAAEILKILPGLIKPIKLNANLVKGRCLYWQEEYMQAISFLEAALKQIPKSYEANYFMAQSYKAAGSIAKALPFFENAIANDTTKGTHLMHEIAVMFYNIENYEKAFQYLQLAKNNGIKQTIEFNNAYCYSAIFAGKLREGKASLDSLIAKRPLDESLVFNAGNIFFNARQYNVAVDYFAATLKLNNKNYKALYMAGLSFIQLGDRKKGESYCDNAISNDPSLAGNRQTSGGVKPSFGL